MLGNEPECLDVSPSGSLQASVWDALVVRTTSLLPRTACVNSPLCLSVRLQHFWQSSSIWQHGNENGLDIQHTLPDFGNLCLNESMKQYSYSLLKHYLDHFAKWEEEKQNKVHFGTPSNITLIETTLSRNKADNLVCGVTPSFEREIRETHYYHGNWENLQNTPSHHTSCICQMHYHIIIFTVYPAPWRARKYAVARLILPKRLPWQCNFTSFFFSLQFQYIHFYFFVSN